MNRGSLRLDGFLPPRPSERKGEPFITLPSYQTLPVHARAHRGKVIVYKMTLAPVREKKLSI